MSEIMKESDRKRLVILHYSLAIEKVASKILSFIFDIDDYKDTRSFGNKSMSLSFNQKMNLLLDYKAIESGDIQKLEAVMNVRNKFLHNADCETFEDAIASLKGVDKNLRNLYPDAFKSGTNEECLERAISFAFIDCAELLSTPKGGIDEKITKENQRKVYKEITMRIGKNASEKFSELALEVNNNSFDFGDKNLLMKRLLKLRNDVFNLE